MLRKRIQILQDARMITSGSLAQHPCSAIPSYQNTRKSQPFETIIKLELYRSFHGSPFSSSQQDILLGKQILPPARFLSLQLSPVPFVVSGFEGFRA